MTNSNLKIEVGELWLVKVLGDINLYKAIIKKVHEQCVEVEYGREGYTYSRTWKIDDVEFIEAIAIIPGERR